MRDSARDILVSVFTEVAENMAFMFAESPEDGPPPASPPFIEASMRFIGPFTGSVSIVVPQEMCSTIAANVLGVEPDDDMITARPYDALKELLNVTCGNLLPTLAGEEPVFDLTVPEVRELDEKAWKTLCNDPSAACLILEDVPVILIMTRD